MKKREKGINNAFLIIMIILILAMIIYLFYIFSILGKEELYSSFIVSDHIGFDLNKTALTFGLIQPGESATREINLANNFNKRVKIIFKSKGNISDFIIVSQNDFIMNPNETKTIIFSVFPPKNISLGKYEGKIEVYFRRAF